MPRRHRRRACSAAVCACAQPAEGYRVAIDPFLLAAAVEAATSDERLLDLGCGVGAAGLALLTRLAGLYEWPAGLSLPGKRLRPLLSSHAATAATQRPRRTAFRGRRPATSWRRKSGSSARQPSIRWCCNPPFHGSGARRACRRHGHGRLPWQRREGAARRGRLGRGWRWRHLRPTSGYG